VSADRYVVAADGGNSKTDLVLARGDGAVLARVRGPGIRPMRNGMDGTARALAELSATAVREAQLSPATTLSGATFFLANVDTADEEAAMHSALVRLEVAEQIEVGNDTLAVLQAGAPRGWGVAVVAGAGINAAGSHPDGRTERFLGIGSFSGDWGGGWSVAVAGIGAAVRAGDGRGAPTALRDRVAAQFGDDAETVAVLAHSGEIPRERVLGFAPVVCAAAGDGDPVATGIVHRLADEVVEFAGALLRRMELTTADPDVVLGGGMLQAGHAVLLERIYAGVAAVAPDAQVRVLDVAPVVGAVTSALRGVGADDVALTSVRSALPR
jgi:N-acetylglucosamine kinase-like BadF-type ATPase